ncbi:MAG TPA: GntR family transcriptional regulator [Acidobacteriaceae bacterium]|jgi:DNA-binding transcriptional regulator YhcF (GntR family)|nr:GntR family transcriptional regulator [Acidobacteriaceae bacterium]
MVQLWFLHSGEVSLCEQMVTQVRMAVLSGELKPGERLPSVRALAHRYGIHRNTVSSAYQKLEQANWLEMRHGSGVYVREAGSGRSAADPGKIRELSVDRMIAALLAAARECGMRPAAVQQRVQSAIERSQVRRLVLMEPDEELRQIVLCELRTVVTLPLSLGALPAAGAGESEDLEGALVLVLPSNEVAARASLPEGAPLLVLRIRSAADSLTRHLPAPKTSLIGIASRWPKFLDVARTMLLAAGVDEDALVVRDARLPDWQMGLREAAAIVCDSWTAQSVAAGVRVLRFPLVADASLAELREIEGAGWTERARDT